MACLQRDKMNVGHAGVTAASGASGSFCLWELLLGLWVSYSHFGRPRGFAVAYWAHDAEAPQQARRAAGALVGLAVADWATAQHQPCRLCAVATENCTVAVMIVGTPSGVCWPIQFQVGAPLEFLEALVSKNPEAFIQRVG